LGFVADNGVKACRHDASSLHAFASALIDLALTISGSD
jgi:hypothetical protein